MSDVACGIDFGTSNSSLSLATRDDDHVRAVPVEGDDLTIPSALYFQGRGVVKFGRDAETAYADIGEGRFMRSLKRVLGTSLMNQTTLVNGRGMEFSDIIGQFVGYMRGQIDADVSDVVMGRPVFFVDGDADANIRAEDQLREIAKHAGFKNIEFQFEPIAAAFSHEVHLTAEKLAIVIDIGGGTSDFTILRLSPDRRHKTDRSDDILANTGVRIGGNDFDKAFSVHHFMPHMGYQSKYGAKDLTVPRLPFFELSEWSKVNFVYSQKNLRDFTEMQRHAHAPERLGRFYKMLEEQLGHIYLNAVEHAKIDLTDTAQLSVNLGFIEDGLKIDTDADDLNVSIEKDVLSVREHSEKCISMAGIKNTDIDLVILTGGSTEIPLVRDTLCGVFPNAEVSDEDKLGSVGIGLGYDAKRRFL